MSHDKISLVVLGSEDSLKIALITVILGNDSAKKTKIYENKMFVIRTPDMKRLNDDARNADLSLLVVKDGCSVEEVLDQLDQLQRSTGKPPEEFTVVLPLGHRAPKPDLFNCCTVEQLISNLSRMVEERGLMPASRSPAGPAAALPGGCHPAGEAAAGKRPRVHSVVNLVLLGMSGSGKSASGNTILGKKIFTSRASSNQITMECQVQEADLGGGVVRVVDTPDILDDDINPATKAGHVRRCKALCRDGDTVFLLVLHVSRFTDGERGALRKLRGAFGPTVLERTVVLFTRADDLRREGLSLERFLTSCQPDLQDLVAACGRRCVSFENSDSHFDQVQKLMEVVHRLLG